jgi:uncharacterized protein (DUF2147 family)
MRIAAVARRKGIVVLRLFNLFVTTITLFGVAILAHGQEGSAQTSGTSDTITPVGRWQTVDEVTGKITSVVDIREQNGKLYGKIERLINPDPNDPDPRCVRCSGDLKDRRLVGLRIVWDLTKNGGQWTGGEILDPDNGKIYRCSITVKDGGKKLRVRGFIGFSLLGRTEYWLRDE